MSRNLEDGRELFDRLATGSPRLVLLALLAMPRPRNDIRKRLEKSVSPSKIGRVEGKLFDWDDETTADCPRKRPWPAAHVD
jgi:hypothetical protein